MKEREWEEIVREVLAERERSEPEDESNKPEMLMPLTGERNVRTARRIQHRSLSVGGDYNRWEATT
ncbi:hypothetical protein [Mesorhizobium caraganae]|uniref:hypothetical protein n=1 Tax=Mesorhizobium caraganae TaxID=483206 RepID=UPI00333A7587